MLKKVIELSPGDRIEVEGNIVTVFDVRKSTQNFIKNYSVTYIVDRISGIIFYSEHDSVFVYE